MSLEPLSQCLTQNSFSSSKILEQSVSKTINPSEKNSPLQNEGDLQSRWKIKNNFPGNYSSVTYQTPIFDKKSVPDHFLRVSPNLSDKMDKSSQRNYTYLPKNEEKRSKFKVNFQNCWRNSDGSFSSYLKTKRETRQSSRKQNCEENRFPDAGFFFPEIDVKSLNQNSNKDFSSDAKASTFLSSAQKKLPHDVLEDLAQQAFCDCPKEGISDECLMQKSLEDTGDYLFPILFSEQSNQEGFGESSFKDASQSVFSSPFSEQSNQEGFGESSFKNASQSVFSSPFSEQSNQEGFGESSFKDASQSVFSSPFSEQSNQEGFGESSFKDASQSVFSSPFSEQSNQEGFGESSFKNASQPVFSSPFSEQSCQGNFNQSPSEYMQQEDTSFSIYIENLGVLNSE